MKKALSIQIQISFSEKELLVFTYVYKILKIRFILFLHLRKLLKCSDDSESYPNYTKQGNHLELHELVTLVCNCHKAELYAALERPPMEIYRISFILKHPITQRMHQFLIF